MSQKFISSASIRDKYLFRITGIDSVSKRHAWWLVRAFPHKYAIFSVLIKKGHLNLTDYGEILSSGFGETIPSEILQQYGFKAEE